MHIQAHSRRSDTLNLKVVVLTFNGTYLPSGCISPGLYVCLFACLYVCLSVCLSVCLCLSGGRLFSQLDLFHGYQFVFYLVMQYVNQSAGSVRQSVYLSVCVFDSKTSFTHLTQFVLCLSAVCQSVSSESLLFYTVNYQCIFYNIRNWIIEQCNTRGLSLV